MKTIKGVAFEEGKALVPLANTHRKARAGSPRHGTPFRPSTYLDLQISCKEGSDLSV
jgi:hypothetical protein